MAHQMPPNVEDSEWTEVLYFLVPPFWSYLFITMCYIKQTCLAFRSWLFSVGKFCHCKALSLFMRRTYKWCIHRVKSWICIVSTLQSPAACFINSYKFIGLKKYLFLHWKTCLKKTAVFPGLKKMKNIYCLLVENQGGANLLQTCSSAVFVRCLGLPWSHSWVPALGWVKNVETGIYFEQQACQIEKPVLVWGSAK